MHANHVLCGMYRMLYTLCHVHCQFVVIVIDKCAQLCISVVIAMFIKYVKHDNDYTNMDEFT